MVAIIFGDEVAFLLHFLYGIGYANTQSCRLDHGEVVEIVANRDRVLDIDAKDIAKPLQTIAFVYTLAVELHVAVGREGDIHFFREIGNL